MLFTQFIKFEPLMDEVQDKMEIMMDCSDTGAHESVAEQNNGVIEECHRIVMHRLPHKTIPKVMIEVLMKETIKQLNMFPAKHDVSSLHSPSASLGNPNYNAMNICNMHKQEYQAKWQMTP